MNKTLCKVIESPPLDYKTLAERAATFLRRVPRKVRALYREIADYASVKLVLWLDADFKPVESYSPHSTYTVTTFLSSRDSLFTFVFLKGRMKQVWYPMDPTSVPSELLAYTNSISTFLEEHNYRLLEGPVLDELAPGHVTELDGQPATVFQVLFAELV